jgi:hypothetical protein
MFRICTDTVESVVCNFFNDIVTSSFLIEFIFVLFSKFCVLVVLIYLEYIFVTRYEKYHGYYGGKEESRKFNYTDMVIIIL